MAKSPFFPPIPGAAAQDSTSSRLPAKLIPLGACARCGAPIFVPKPDVAGEWFFVPEAKHSCRCWLENSK